MESILFDIFWCYLESFYLFTNKVRVEIKLEKHKSQKTSCNPDQKQISLHLKVRWTRFFPTNFRI